MDEYIETLSCSYSIYLVTTSFILGRQVLIMMLPIRLAHDFDTTERNKQTNFDQASELKSEDTPTVLRPINYGCSYYGLIVARISK